jgi:hypothetical protein
VVKWFIGYSPEGLPFDSFDLAQDKYTQDFATLWLAGGSRSPPNQAGARNLVGILPYFRGKIKKKGKKQRLADSIQRSE